MPVCEINTCFETSSFKLPYLPAVIRLLNFAWHGENEIGYVEDKLWINLASAFVQKCLDKNIGQGNPICSLETLHQGNLRHHGSCKDDIDRFKIPLFPLLDIGTLWLLEVSLQVANKSFGSQLSDHIQTQSFQRNLLDLPSWTGVTEPEAHAVRNPNNGTPCLCFSYVMLEKRFYRCETINLTHWSVAQAAKRSSANGLLLPTTQWT